MIGIYKITSPSGKIYIGQTTNVVKRIAIYRAGHCKKQFALHASLKKHGFEAHLFEVIEECTADKLDNREEYWIKHFDTFNTPHGLNLKSGGLTNKWSEESKLKLSEAKKGKPRPDLAGKPSKLKGRKLSEDHKRKILNSLKGRKFSPSTIELLRTLNTGRNHTEETKAKMKLSAKGKVFTDEHKANAIKGRLESEKVGKTVVNIQTGETYKNLKFLCSEKGLSYGSLKNQLRGARKNNTPYQYLKATA